MADVIQGVIDNFRPAAGASTGSGISFPQISALTGLLISMIFIMCFVLFIILYKFFVYKIKILELEDRGRGSLVGKLLSAKKVEKNGTTRYQILGKRTSEGKPFQIIASSTDNIIPLRMPLGFYRDIVIMHKDKIGDYRPWQVLTNKDQINLDKFTYADTKTGNKRFQIADFLSYFFPVLRIDNQQMREWFVLMTKEALSIYQDPSEVRKKVINIMIALFIVGGLGAAAYIFLS